MNNTDQLNAQLAIAAADPRIDADAPLHSPANRERRDEAPKYTREQAEATPATSLVIVATRTLADGRTECATIVGSDQQPIAFRSEEDAQAYLDTIPAQHMFQQLADAQFGDVYVRGLDPTGTPLWDVHVGSIGADSADEYELIINGSLFLHAETRELTEDREHSVRFTDTAEVDHAAIRLLNRTDLSEPIALIRALGYHEGADEPHNYAELYNPQLAIDIRDSYPRE